MAEAPQHERQAINRPERSTVAPAQGDSTGMSSEPSDLSGLTIAEAASAFEVSSATLRRLVSAGRLEAWRVSGVRGREWRVSADALAEAGYTRRAIDLTEAGAVSLEVRRLAQALTAERARSARLDSELGYALLTVGRLRGRLRDAGIDPDQMFGTDLETGPEASQ